MPELDATALRATLVVPQGPYAGLTVVASTGSTNADLREAATQGASDRTVLIALEQTAGVGRRGRTWSSPKNAGLYTSVLLRPTDVPFAELGSLAVVAGLAVLDVTAAMNINAVLKWPNDVLAGPQRQKTAGILSEVVPGQPCAVVVGIGLNIAPPLEAFPLGAGGLPATSLTEQGATNVDQHTVLTSLLRGFAERERRWRAAGGDLQQCGLLDEYRQKCVTLGQRVRVYLPDASELCGTAVDVDAAGQLILQDAGGLHHTVLAGDVVHVRADP